MLLNRLLLGHLLDLQVDMTKTIRVAMAAMPQITAQKLMYRPITDLFVAVMLRYARDQQIHASICKPCLGDTDVLWLDKKGVFDRSILLSELLSAAPVLA